MPSKSDMPLPVDVQAGQVIANAGTGPTSPWSVSGAVTTSPTDTTVSFDTTSIQNQLQQIRMQNNRLACIQADRCGEFIPFEETLPFLAG